MTDQPNPAAPPPGDEPTPAAPPPSPWTPPAETQAAAAATPGSDPAREETSTYEAVPAVEAAEPGTSVPAVAVARDPAATGGEPPAGGRRTGLRWAVALGGVAIVIGATAAILALASGRPATSIAVGYMPADTVSYSEYRLDLPGDQRAKVAGFLSAFPGFADQSTIETKLNEVFDRIVKLASQDKQAYTTDIQPWFGGQIALGQSLPKSAGSVDSSLISPVSGGEMTIIVTVKDATKAADWVRKTAGDGVTESQYNGATMFVPASAGSGSFAVAINEEVMIGGTDAAVRAAVDSKGDGKLADDAEFKAAFSTVAHDYVTFSYVEYQALIKASIELMGANAGFDRTTVDDEIVAMIPAWFAGSARFENDAIVGEGAYPSVDIGFDTKNKRSTLVGHAPPNSLLYSESHDIGAALTALLERFRQMPDLRDAFSQIDQAAGIVGGIDGTFGWWGDVAVVVAKGADGTLGGGLLIAPTDVEAAKRTFETLRSFIVLGGGQAGVQLRDVQHGDTTVTIVDFSEAAGSSMDLPPGYKAEIAYAVTNDVIVIGYGEAFVNSVLDAGPGPSLADDSRFKDLAGRVGDENIGLSFVDIRAFREIIEPLVRDEMPADSWAFYEKEIQPYLLPFDAVVSAARIDGDLNRLPQSITVKKP